MNFLRNLKNRLLPKEEPIEIIQIIPRVYATEFPSKEKTKSLLKVLNKINDKFKIWNVSEYQYDSKPFDFNVMDHSRAGYPSPVFLDLLVICTEMSSWLDSGPDNCVFIHCQKSFARTALTLSFFLTFIRFSKSAEEASVFLREKLKSEFLKNHLLYIKHCNRLLNLKDAHQHPLRLRKVHLNQTPLIRLHKKHAEDPFLVSNTVFKPYLQIFVDKQIVYNSIDDQ